MANLANKLKQTRLPAPVGGINAVDPGVELPARDCLYAYNVIATEQGVRSRTGWREWCTGLSGQYSDEVRTTMSFHGSGVINSRLFQTTDTGIWDVTASSTSPTQVYAFATVTPTSGWGVAAAVVTTAGHFLVYADEVNGLHYYSETTGVWAAYATGTGTGQISGVDPTAIVSVTMWKNRLWLTQRDTAKAWYLDAGAIFGTATAFNFGGRFAHGGHLRGLFNWSTDGGSGLDTSLVAIGSGGDVVIYIGTDPASASTFGLKGVWFVGAVPAGRRIATDLGGDLLILSALGAVPLSRLILGDPDKMQYATAKIGPLFSRLANAALASLGWAMHTHPTDNAMLLLVPQGPGQDTTQLVLSLSARSWTQYRDVPMLCAGAYEGQLFFGTSDGRCCRHVGVVDGVLLSDPSSGDPVEWSLLTGFRGSATQKQVASVRPILISEETAPTYQATARYDFNQVEPAEPTLATAGASTWDYGIIQGTISTGALAGTFTLEVALNASPGGSGTLQIGGSFGTENWSWADSTTEISPGVYALASDQATVFDHEPGDSVLLTSAHPDTTGMWNHALWAGSNNPSTGFQGTVGMGRDIAVAIRGSARARTTLVGVDLLYSEGGYL